MIDTVHPTSFTFFWTSSSLWDFWKCYMFICMLCKNFLLQLDNWTCQNLRNEAFTQRRKSQVKSLPCLSTSPHPAPCLSLTLFILQLLILILNKKKSGSFAAVSSYDGSASFNCRRELTGGWRLTFEGSQLSSHVMALRLTKLVLLKFSNIPPKI